MKSGNRFEGFDPATGDDPKALSSTTWVLPAMKIWIAEKDSEVAAGVTKAAAVQAMRDHLEQNRLDPRYPWHAPDERPWTVSEVERESRFHQVELAGARSPMMGHRARSQDALTRTQPGNRVEGRLEMHPIGTPGYDPAEQPTRSQRNRLGPHNLESDSRWFNPYGVGEGGTSTTGFVWGSR